MTCNTKLDHNLNIVIINACAWVRSHLKKGVNTLPLQMHAPPACASKDLYSSRRWCHTTFVEKGHENQRKLKVPRSHVHKQILMHSCLCWKKKFQTKESNCDLKMESQIKLGILRIVASLFLKLIQR